MLHVCSLSKLPETVVSTGAKSVITLINAEEQQQGAIIKLLPPGHHQLFAAIKEQDEVTCRSILSHNRFSEKEVNAKEKTLIFTRFNGVVMVAYEKL